MSLDSMLMLGNRFYLRVQGQCLVGAAAAGFTGDPASLARDKINDKVGFDKVGEGGGCETPSPPNKCCLIWSDTTVAWY